MAGQNLFVASDANFDQEILKADKPALVDFWARWCGPCRALAPLIEQLADQYHDRVRVAKLDVDENPKTATSYGVRSIPTVLLFKEGKVLDTLVGLVPKDRLETFLKQAL